MMGGGGQKHSKDFANYEATEVQEFKLSALYSEVKVEKEKKLRVVSCLVHKNGWTAFENERRKLKKKTGFKWYAYTDMNVSGLLFSSLKMVVRI